MIPVKLTLSGFLSYKDPVTIDFTAFDLACIAGPNGAGKSSLLDALTYALFGKARRADETLINLASDAAFVELIFAPISQSREGGKREGAISVFGRGLK